MEKSALEERIKQDVLEKYYYGFSSTELCEDFEDYVKDKMKNMSRELENTLEERGPQVKTYVAKLDELWLEKVKEPLSKFQVESRKIFAIPSNVTADQKKYSDEDVAKLRKEVEDLQTELIRQKTYLVKCKQHKDILENRIKPHCENMNTLLATRNSQTPQEENVNIALKPHEEQLKYYLKNDKFMSLELLVRHF